MLRSFLLASVALAGCQAVSTETAPAPDPVGAAVQDLLSSVPNMMEAHGVDGLALTLVQNDTVLASAGIGRTADGQTYSDATSCGLYSATKFLTSLTLASLVEDGAISMDWTMDELMADAPEAWKPITLAQLYNHSHGIPMVVRHPDFAALAEDPTRGNAAALDWVRDEPLDFEPGSTTRYRQSGHAVGETVLGDRLGQNFAELMATHVTDPAGADATFNAEYARVGGEPLLISAGSFQTSAQQMGKIFVALNSGAIVDPDVLEDFLYTEDYIVEGYSINSILDEVDGYRTVGHRGGGARANIRYAPSARTGVMICTDDTSNDELAITLADQLMSAALTGKTAE